MLRRGFSILTFALAVQAAPALAQPGCVTAPSPEIATAVRAYFAALARDDAVGARRLTADGFYAYDVGKRFTAPELSEAIFSAHRSGVKLEWNLGEIDTHAACGQGWAAWVNTGAVGDAAGMRPMTWLESAVLRRERGRWVLVFLHSTRVPPLPVKGSSQ